DVELAYAFFKATEIVSDKPLPYGIAENERALELRLGQQLAASSPELAVQLGRKSLAKGFFNDLLPTLKRLSKKHKEQATVLYKEIVQKLKSTNLDSDWSVRYFAHTLVSSYFPPEADELTFRELINFLMSNALAQGCGNKMEDNDERADSCRWI